MRGNRISSQLFALHPFLMAFKTDFLFSSDCEDSWHAEGLQMDLVDPMKKWKLAYEGPMIHQSHGTSHQVTLKVRVCRFVLESLS